MYRFLKENGAKLIFRGHEVPDTVEAQMKGDLVALYGARKFYGMGSHESPSPGMNG
jgi:hypothetical protein